MSVVLLFVLIVDVLYFVATRRFREGVSRAIYLGSTVCSMYFAVMRSGRLCLVGSYRDSHVIDRT
jgi:hypothetical protein